MKYAMPPPRIKPNPINIAPKVLSLATENAIIPMNTNIIAINIPIPPNPPRKMVLVAFIAAIGTEEADAAADAAAEAAAEAIVTGAAADIVKYIAAHKISGVYVN